MHVCMYVCTYRMYVCMHACMHVLIVDLCVCVLEPLKRSRTGINQLFFGLQTRSNQSLACFGGRSRATETVTLITGNYDCMHPLDCTMFLVCCWSWPRSGRAAQVDSETQSRIKSLFSFRVRFSICDLADRAPA
jgi:hypothetical protein